MGAYLKRPRGHMPLTSKSLFFPIFIRTLKPPFSTISRRLKIPHPSKNHQHIFLHLSGPISKNRFFQFFITSENLNFRPREGYSGSNQYHFLSCLKKIRRKHTLNQFFDELNDFFDIFMYFPFILL